jgi:hypothetical protein
MDIDGPPWEPHEYWKMKVASFHKDDSSKQTWVVGSWFYTPSSLTSVIKSKERYLEIRSSPVFTLVLTLSIERLLSAWEIQSWSSLLIGMRSTHPVLNVK